MKDLDETVDRIAKDLNALASLIPKEIDRLKKNISPDEAKKMAEALKVSDYKNKIKEMQKAKEDYDNFMKNI